LANRLNSRKPLLELRDPVQKLALRPAATSGDLQNPNPQRYHADEGKHIHA
jgi:hypothetical protein